MAPVEKKTSAEKNSGTGGNNKKWSDAAERDLLITMLSANAVSGAIKVNWSAVKSGMDIMGYNFTESAITQKFGKTLLPNFRKTHGDDIVARIAAPAVGTSGGPVQVSTPRKTAAGSAGGSASASKRKKNAFTPINTPSKTGKNINALAGEDDDDDGDVDGDTPSKKVKPEADCDMGNDQPVGFEEWLKMETPDEA